ncbi:M20 family metallopeptidase [Streptomyces albus subsp. chlorinus]|uniref:M20 family metallopeptidase n=1 Tax=Streptomyces albus TaxID=1888 RepID=UPI00156F3539|nr:M20 family metallopeptidase [Streptomyces albus]NSC19932.1 M20 family metallopeptidase [Streptomyces albus subsp. chlorinus]
MNAVPNASALRGIDVVGLHRWLEAHRAQLLDDVLDLVGRETPSDDPVLLDRGLARIERWITDTLGEPQRRSRTDGGPYGDALTLEFPGVGSAPVVLLGHYDTVWQAGTLAEWPCAVDGDRASGPGIFDMKAGLVQAVWALRALDATGHRRPPVRLVLNGDEEIGSPASRPVIERACAGAAAVLVFEGSADGALKTSRKGVGIFDVTVTGREAHAGLDPEKGVSAIDEMARATLKLHALADPAAGTTVNVGLVRGGSAINVVAGQATARVDVRVASQAEADRVDRALARLEPHDPRAAITVTGEWNRPVMERTPAIIAMAGLARAAAAELGADLAEVAVGGASDGNFAAATGVPVLDGIGAVGDGAHARDEHVSVAALTERSAIAAAVLAAFPKGPTA